VTEADDRFLGTLAGELRPRLGPRVTIIGLDLDRPAPDRVAITVSLASPTGDRMITADGESLTDAAARLLDRAVEFRLADGFRELVGPTRA
jgi:hypothetical protein